MALTKSDGTWVHAKINGDSSASSFSPTYWVQASTAGGGAKALRFNSNKDTVYIAGN